MSFEFIELAKSVTIIARKLLNTAKGTGQGLQVCALSGVGAWRGIREHTGLREAHPDCIVGVAVTCSATVIQDF